MDQVADLDHNTTEVIEPGDDLSMTTEDGREFVLAVADTFPCRMRVTVVITTKGTNIVINRHD